MPGARQDSERPQFDDNHGPGAPSTENPPEMPENAANHQNPQNGMMEPGSMDSTFAPSGGMPTEASNNHINSGDVVSIVDKNGNTVYKFTALKSANSVLYSSDSLNGDEYNLLINETETSNSESDPIAPNAKPTNTEETSPIIPEKDQKEANKDAVASSTEKTSAVISVSNSRTINAITTTVEKSPVQTGVEAGASIWASMSAALGLAGTALFRKKRK